MTDPTLERWRLVLGEPGARCAPAGLPADAAARDAALDWLYGRDPELARRGVRTGGDAPSLVTAVDWLDDVHRLFPKETIERLERDAVERYGIEEIVTDPAVLERVEPNSALLRAVLRTKHLMNPELLDMARRIIASVVRQLLEQLATEVRTSVAGPRLRRPSLVPNSRNFDFHATLRANLRRYDPELRRIAIERPKFVSRSRRHVERWQLVLLVDQSGSMVGSVIHAAVTAACLWSVPGLRTHLVAFDTAVVDLTDDVADPVELLMRVQLGGGTDIANAVEYGAGLIDNPRRAIVAVISDFYEGGSEASLVRRVRSLVEQGTTVIGLAALDTEANPDYDRGTAARLVEAGAHVGAMTPGELAAFVADCLAGR
ncbi:VWA domain-containing protein [Pseudonocardia sp. TRM90224]|uniref:VWA domain-containing protein n=1 Tax=Pseudonocardia sp. TRM90224 TaxID=2812678 RepID=UPI001E5B8466|nr:VWA domain-containing protein [Pseudonocardia sp. TRM90224]